MASFKTALEALAKGKLKLESLSMKLDILLNESPHFANKILLQLDEVYEKKELTNKQYTHLKKQINQFRRTHAIGTEVGQSSCDDSTRFAQESIPSKANEDVDEPTRVMSDEEKASNISTDENNAMASSVEINLLDSDTSASSIISSTDSPEISDIGNSQWDDTTIPVVDLSGGYGKNSIIKQRFKLEKILGEGGMGRVYKAIDLLKAEAKDKRPYVAIKLLNDDFKDHPEAFISLQREASRQQKLAHPNIVTIYDFDRVGGPNTPIFITMELMEGMELKDYIKKKVRPRGGLPFKEVYDIIKQLGAGLIYAHERNLVHSDFKPSNAFLCNDGTVKTLDFGIARAVKNPVTGEAEKTLFDPSKLGALTPAYASLEMLEGEEPDTRDDIYALGCTTYELLTGKHPFTRIPANKAKENNLEPPYIKTLNKKQNRALRRIVAFHRADRSPTVEHFLEEFKGKATWHKNPFVIAVGILLVISLMLVNPALDYIHKKELKNITTEIAAGREQIIVAKLDKVRQLEPADQTSIINNDAAKQAIQNYFSDKVADLIDTSGDTYNFPAADNVLEEIAHFYPDSIFFQEQQYLVSRSSKEIIGELTKQYVMALKDPSLIDNTQGILNKISQIDPAHPLIEDPRPSNAYCLLAQEKFKANEFSVALDLIQSGRASEAGANDPRLADLETKILRAQKIVQFESDLNLIKDKLTSLTDFKQHEKAITELAGLKPDSQLISSLSASLKPIIQFELDSIIKSNSRGDAETLAADFGDLMNSLQLNEQLTKIKLANLKGAVLKQYVKTLASNDISNIESALANARIGDPQWETNMLKNIQELNTLVKEDKSIAPSLERFRAQISELYIAKADETLQTGRFDAADSFIDIGERFMPGAQNLLDIRHSIANAREEAERRDRIEANKTDLKAYTDGNQIAEALKIYEQLKADLPESDQYISFEVPQMLSNSFARLAQSKAGTNDYTAAHLLAVKGLQIKPDNRFLKTLKNEYQAEANIAELTKLFNSPSLLFPSGIKLKVNQIENGNLARYAEFSKASAKILAKRINDLRMTDKNAAAGFARTVSQLFPANAILADLRNQLQLEPWAGLVAANAAIAVGKLTQATQLQQMAKAKFATHPDFITFSTLLENKIKEANSVYEIYLQDKKAAGKDYGKLRTAKNLLVRAQALWVDSPEYRTAETKLDQLIIKFKPTPKPKIRAAEKSLDDITIATASGSGMGTTVAAPWKPIDSDSECTSRLAGYGRRAKAICFDMIHSAARGPLMVVVPDGDRLEKPFAIAKYEISINDWSKYCILSGNCQAIKNKERKNEPITGISLKQAQNYAAWLSERTGKIYRIPTKSEWEYAASAGGKQPGKDFNCRVAVGEKLIKGTGLVSVKSGKSNGWGLKNYIGNVQEWVIDGNAVMVRGGAFTDAHSKCDISLERDHDGNPDETTGFRIMREDVG